MNNYRLDGSRTLLNLANAYTQKVQSKRRYSLYSDYAAQKKQPVIKAVFLELSQEEEGHSDVFYEYLIAGMNDASPNANTSVHIALGTIAENLSYSSLWEYEQWSSLFPLYTETAWAEGYEQIATTFSAMIENDQRHDLLLRDYLERFSTCSMYFTDYQAEWKCLYCGYRHYGMTAPQHCPFCNRPQEYFLLAKTV